MRSGKYITAILIAAAVSACGKIEKLPPEPSISFTSFEIFDSTDVLGNINKAGILKFHFQDGDGDIGLNAPVSSEEDSINLFLSVFRKTKSGYSVIISPEDPLYTRGYRIPYMEREGQNKIMKGTISVTFMYLFFDQGDTIKYDFYIKDRAEHSSNVVSTCDITLDKNGICGQMN
ncbi:MAG: hypothetical protein U0X39_06305 [Bacteroidales bacterium]